MTGWTRRSVIGACLGAAGCAAWQRPPLDVLYGGNTATEQPPLVLIPGAFGSSLRDRRSAREIWPASDSRLLLGNYRDLELPIDPRTLEPVAGNVEAYDIFRQGLGRDFYGQVLDTLERVGGYVRCRPDSKPRAGQRSLYLYLYDFRLDNVASVQGLEALIEQIRADHGDSRLKVDVLAHSNGGLLARYYARYGSAGLPMEGPFEPTYAGAGAIRRLLLVGTPNLGTIQPVLSHLRGEEIGLRRIPAEVMATWNGVPQLMPHPTVPWLIDLDGRVIHVDLFDTGTWREFAWSLYDPAVVQSTIEHHGGGAKGESHLETLRAYMAKHFARGRRFAESLGGPADARDIDPYVFGGDCELTLARLCAETVSGRTHAREHVADIVAPVRGVDYEALMFEPGDTVVTRASLIGRGPPRAAPDRSSEPLRLAHTVFLCERHQQLTGNPSFQDNLLHVLFSPDA